QGRPAERRRSTSRRQRRRHPGQDPGRVFPVTGASGPPKTPARVGRTTATSRRARPTRELAMKAVAVLPGTPNSVHLRDIPAPTLDTQPHPHVCRIPAGRGVLVQSLQIGVDATDREINEALYGNAPPGGDYLVIGHESFGRVLAVGDRVTEVRPGDYVSCTVRRPGKSVHDLIGRNDVTGEETYYERGINLCHG